MQPDWSTSALVQYGLTAAGTLASLALIIAVKLEIGRVRQNSARDNGELRIEVRALEESVRRVRQDAVGQRPMSSAPAGPGLNLTRRSKVLRMHHRGETVETIAAALQTPRNEIELLLKVHRTLQAPLADHEGDSDNGRLAG